MLPLRQGSMRLLSCNLDMQSHQVLPLWWTSLESGLLSFPALSLKISLRVVSWALRCHLRYARGGHSMSRCPLLFRH
jgi:hypothetical protein